MVSFLYGDYGSGKSTYILKEIEKDCQSKISTFLIVPEQQTVIKERQIASLLPSSAQLYCEASNFTRLSNRVFRDLGGLKYNYVTKSGKNLLMYRAICECRSRLKAYKIEEKHEKSAIKMFLEVIGEFKSYSVSMLKLERAIKELSDNEALRIKLEDLLTIWSTYEALLYERFSDPYDDMTMLAEKIEESNYFKGANVYVDSFYGFSEAQLNVLEKIIASASNVTFAFDCPYEATKKATTQFSMVAKNANNVAKLCSYLGKDVSKIMFDTDHKHKSEDMALAAKYIWDFTKEKIANSENITLARCSDEFEECEYVSSEICRLIMQGYKYSDIAIIARSTSNYIGILDYTLKKYNIPHFLSSPTEWLTKPLLKMIFSALNFVDSHRREDILTLAKSGYIDIDPASLADFESYIVRWDIYGKRFLDDDYWSANPDGFVEKPTSLQEEKLTRALNVRKLLLDRLFVLEKAFSSNSTVSELAIAVFEFLNSNKIVDKLEEERKQSSKADSYVLSQIWQAILDALDTLVDICGDAIVDAGTFSTLLHYAFIDARVGTIPTGEDNVIIADAHSIRAENIRHVFILGANEGSFPASISSNSIFSDADKIALCDFDITLSAKNEERADDELMFFKTSLAIASEGAHICALTTGIDGSARQPSIGYKRIESLFENIKRVDVSKIDTIDKIYTKNIAKEYLGVTKDELHKAILNELGTCDSCSVDFSNENERLSPKTVDSLFGRSLRLSQSQVSSFKTCKFKYYSEQHLKLSGDKQYFFSSLDSGTLVHSVFEHFIKMLKDTPDKFNELTSEEIKKAVDEITGEYISLVCKGVHMSNRLLHHFERLRRNLYIFVEKLVFEFKHSKFKPEFIELEFGLKDNLPQPLTFELGGGRSAYMIGKADRVDTYRANGKTYIRVADYKIGKKSFTKSELEVGNDIQLPLYLFSLCKMKDCDFKKKLLKDTSELVPAGFFFMPLNIGKLTLNKDISADLSTMEKSERDELEMASAFSGRFLDDDEIIFAQDENPGGSLLPSTGKARRSHYISIEGFEELYEKMTNSIIAISNEIYSGNATAKPKMISSQEACAFCDQRAFCRRRSK